MSWSAIIAAAFQVWDRIRDSRIENAPETKKSIERNEAHTRNVSASPRAIQAPSGRFDRSKGKD